MKGVIVFMFLGLVVLGLAFGSTIWFKVNMWINGNKKGK